MGRASGEEDSHSKVDRKESTGKVVKEVKKVKETPPTIGGSFPHNEKGRKLTGIRGTYREDPVQ